MNRVLIAVGFMLMAGLAQAWNPPERNGVTPSPEFEDRFEDVLERILNRQNELLLRTADSADASAVTSQGRFALTQVDFSSLDQAPVLNDVWVWEASSGSYSESVGVEFSTHALANGSSSLEDAAVAEIDETLRTWQRDLINLRDQIDPQVFQQLNEYYFKMRRYLSGQVRLQGADQAFISQASVPLSDTEDFPVALSVSVYNPEQGRASLDYIVSNPQAQVARATRQDGTVGAVGQPLMDYDFRRLRSIDGVQRIELDAQNNRVGSFARQRGFRSVCGGS